MPYYLKDFKRGLLLLSLIFSVSTFYAQELYWIGGSGDWNDFSHWSKRPGNEMTGPAGILPDEDTMVFFDDFSGLANGDVVNIPPGTYAVLSFTVATRNDFTLQFSGTFGSIVEMAVGGDLTLSEEMIITYASTSSFHNTWVFSGAGDHDITTAGQDLLSVEFNDENGKFNQLDNLKATAQIRLVTGTWNSNGFDVHTDFAWFRDSGNSPATALPKQLNTGGSDFYAAKWDSGLTYGSLVMNGPHRIFAEIFEGSSRQPNGVAFFIDEIILLELSDQNPPSTSIIEYNNFECPECVVKTIRVRDTGNTKFAGKFTVTELFAVENPASVIQFNGGNGRESEITLNGTVTTPPVSGCDARTVFTNIHNDFSTIIRNAGTLTVKDAELNNLQATGGATFNLSNGVLSGSSSGWNVINAPQGIDYFWVGVGGQATADWDNPLNWSPNNAVPNGCLPTKVDNVIVDDNSKSGMRIPTGQTVECNDFIWDNDGGLELLIDGVSGNTSRLVVGGDFYVDNSVLISSGSFRELRFFSTQNNTIETNGASLPRLRFAGDNGIWRLNDNLICESITFEGGTLNTQNHNIVTNGWLSSDSNLKAYNFGSSHITVNGDFGLVTQANTNLSLDPGTSLIECEALNYIGEESLYDVKMINSSSTSFRDVRPLTVNRLTLAGSEAVTTQNDLTVDELVFEVPGAWLRIGAADELTVNEAILSQASAGDPGILESQTAGVQVALNKSGGNICVDGPVAFKDIEAVVAGVLHAPEGVDNGNNTGITFDDGLANIDLYWIGGSGDWDVRSNWSRVSGGCPSSKDPSNMNRLFFDDNSFFAEGAEVAISFETCQELYFSNSSFGVTMNVTSELQAELLVLDNAEVNFSGKGLSVNTTTRIDNGGFLRLDLLSYLTAKLESNNNGVVRVLPGTNAIVRPQ